MPKAPKTAQEQYKKLVDAKKPPRPLLRNILAAFFVGGSICAVGQLVLNFLIARGLPAKDALAPTSGAMVFIGGLLTGIGIYDKIGAFGGMGSALPITGFANSIVSPAMEYKREGFVLGVGAKMFIIAGPVIVYGLVTSFIVALFRLLVQGQLIRH
jgi:stage V sporulation protein AC